MANPVLTASHFHNEVGAFAYVEAHLWPKGQSRTFGIAKGIEFAAPIRES
jgi:hypothetical protein